MISIYTPRSTGRSRTLRQATDELVGELRKSNPDMRLSKDHGQIRVGGQAAMSRILTNNSAYGGREMNWLVTALRPEGLVYFIFVAPEGEFGRYQRTFRQILDSVTFRRR